MGGFFGALEGCFAGDFRAKVGREWGVLPRNSGDFGLSESAARRFSAWRTWAGARGEKIFKKGRKTEKLGRERCRKAVQGRTI